MAPRTNDSARENERAAVPPVSGPEDTPDPVRPPAGGGTPKEGPGRADGPGAPGAGPVPRTADDEGAGTVRAPAPGAARRPGAHHRPDAAPDTVTGRAGAGPARAEDGPAAGDGSDTGPGAAGKRVAGKDGPEGGPRTEAEAGFREPATADGEIREPATLDGAGVAPGRIAALRRFAAAARRGPGVHAASCAVLLAVAMTAASVAAGGDREAGRDATAAGGTVAAGVLAGGDLGAGIRSLQAHLRAQPRDFGGWATLGTAYVEQARLQGDPSRYPQAERALERSLALEPDNEPALAGQAALAAARHDFTGALEHAGRALEQNPYSERALCSRIDALVELGRYGEAAEAASTADRRRPGVPVFTRYAYVRELRGDVRTAREVLERALDGAASPADVAYVATALGQLAWNQGEYRTALTHYARALAADDGHLPALEGRARAQAASGDHAGAVGTLERVVARSPLPGPLVALGELYETRGADGDRAKARDQYALVDAWFALARVGGVEADLDTALAAADHGDPAEALRAARAEWERRHSVHTADALAWALHVNGRDEEALRYARRATATGYRNAVFLYHRGMIEKAAGHERAARGSLTAALELNPGFSPLGARAARTALAELEAAR
ncbi:tetratricopeptide repeat protein [Streptomyces sp. CHD11]|uniref:tetratricopeptide repeat protein n=1 Tax=Streptomyces sp. CHD11 TaxID=2741325 RepID=UPI001BFCAE69|nr:tetratricopeptide repeat protein [Streptomyces sp. CHD11]MBT3151808.1 tetratricopeptide repeat protein [Streptomyces sp. CHD11]